MSAPAQRFRPALTVDLVALTVREAALQVLLIERGTAPWRGSWALPGGHLEENDEDLDQAAVRELREETGMGLGTAHLEQLHTYGAAGRDLRERVITVAYLAVIPDPAAHVLAAGDDARAAAWMPVAPILAGEAALAFDHGKIVRAAVERVRSKLERTMLATVFAGPEFTITELRQVYEIVWGAPLDQANFNRKLQHTGVLVPTGEYTTRQGGRPAALYRCDSAVNLHPPIPQPVQ
ncbi:NUDIX domain-containing protein [Nocardia sp. NPDC050435]|uniref:NUDIX hydrolase n=1 Tax=Nocardia sp. NPDC050435 TaxID=3155040 RepID=UPI0033C1AC5F